MFMTSNTYTEIGPGLAAMKAGIVVLIATVVCVVVSGELMGTAIDTRQTLMSSSGSNLSRAAAAGLIDEVVNIIRNGENPNSAGPSGLTPLMEAAWNQHADVVKVLLDNGADPCVADQEGHNARWYSRRRQINFNIPGWAGWHGTVFVPRVFRTDSWYLLRAAMLKCP
jgi:hypothetical protein